MLASTESGRSTWAVRHRLADRDYQEVVNFAFVEERWEQDFAGNAAPIRLANPIASQLSVMRSSLIAGLVGNLVTNRNRQVARVRVFETGRCFARSSEGAPVDGFDQPVMLAALAAGPAVAEQWAVPTRAVDFYDVKSDLEALLAPARAEFVPVSTRLCIRGAVLRCGWAEKRSVWSARSTRPGCSAMSSAVRLWYSSCAWMRCLTPGCRRTRRSPGSPRLSGIWR